MEPVIISQVKEHLGQGWVEHNDNLIRLSAGCN